jgi:hypothetical protein
MFGRFARSLRKPAAAAATARKILAPAPAPARAPAPTFEQLEDRQYMAVSPVIAGTKIKGINLSSGNISTNQTLITVPFTGNINIANAGLIQLRGYAVDTTGPTGAQVKVAVGVVSVNVVAADHSYLQITTDRLMRKGGTIIFYSGSLKDDNGDTLAEQSRRTVKGQNKERFTLACRAFIPTNLNFFTPDLFAGANTPAAASSVIPDSTVDAAFSTFMQFKVNRGLITQDQRLAAIARYNDAFTKQVVPEANMRAALMSLVGTFAEPAIDVYLTNGNLSGKYYSIVAFGTPTDPTVPVAQTVVRSDGRLQCIIRTEFRGESFQVLSGFLAHEALHQDNPVNSLQEEIFATSVETFTVAQQADADQTFLGANTVLVNSENQNLLAMLNSGRTIFPYVGLEDAPMRHAAGGVFQGQKTVSGGNYSSYDDFIRRQYVARGAVSGSSVGNALLNKYYTAITGAAAPAGLAFNESLIQTVDSFQSPIPTKLAMRIAQAFKLRID